MKNASLLFGSVDYIKVLT